MKTLPTLAFDKLQLTLLKFVSLVIVGTLHIDEKVEPKVFTGSIHVYSTKGGTMSEPRDLLTSQEKPVNGLQMITVGGSWHANAME